MLCLGTRVWSTRLHFISIDNASGITAGMRYLARLGHRRIAYLSPEPALQDHLERASAYKRCRSRYHLERDPALLIWKERASDYQTLAADAIDRWFSLPSPPTAIISGGGTLSLHLIDALHARGVRFPRDVSLLAFDDLPMGTPLAVPLTVIDQPLTDLGQAAAHALHLLTEPAHPLISRVLPTSLLIRESCGPPGAGRHETP